MQPPAPARDPLTDYRHFIWDNQRWNRIQPRPGDIYVCTPPKTGTTWTQTIVAMLLYPDGTLPQPVTHLFPWVEARFYPLDEMAEFLQMQTDRRSFKTHTPADGIPWRPDSSYIVVGRDGRDAFMSFVNHLASMRPDSVMELMQSAMEEGIEFRPMPPPDDLHTLFSWWLEDGGFFHLLGSYWEHRDESNVLFVHFDDLKADLEKEVRRIATFLSIPVDEAKLPGILERCSFAWMKANADRIGDFGRLFVGGGESFFFKGTNGRWREELTDEELERYDRRSRELLLPEMKAWLDRSGPRRD